jgi:hypothetical protein
MILDLLKMAVCMLIYYCDFWFVLVSNPKNGLFFLALLVPCASDM